MPCRLVVYRVVWACTISPAIHFTPAPSLFCSSLTHFLFPSPSFASSNSGATAGLLNFRTRAIDATWMAGGFRQYSSRQ
ncbi:hypothetical protein BDQ12DRAFT_265359 [Crucibulum laeve]|uniref:Uncharacterized protein n=1 Tax=Crucibulum laeve TaxID=68775 RepID=A0A5C3LTE8_9AGAR|nr:hypothetical protein BDQ12DRAFT_265359 [Crucibulum laeve]